jgi:hypothetical protein
MPAFANLIGGYANAGNLVRLEQRGALVRAHPLAGNCAT